MPKTPTKWTPEDSGSANLDNGVSYLKTTSTDFLLINGTDRLLLGPKIVTGKTPTVWSDS